MNAAWCTAAAVAVDLIAWPQIVALAKAEPKRLRYRILHTAVRPSGMPQRSPRRSGAGLI
jgi:hypothetical protein